MDTQQTYSFSTWKILLPTMLGMGVIFYMLWKELFGSGDTTSIDSLKELSITWNTIFWFFVALLLMVGRDLGFTIRYRYLTDKFLSWKQCVKVTLLAEFGSAITPSSIGGSSMAVLFLAKEKVSVGKSAAIVFVTMLLDEMFFVVTFPILLLFIPIDTLFSKITALETSIMSLFALAYLIKLLLCICLIIGLFFKPQFIKWILVKIFKLRFLRKWQSSAEKAGNDLIISSDEIRGKRFNYWFPLILATILSWCSRYLVVNAIFVAFFPVTDHLIIFARQFIMWILMVISITPGGSGLSEIVFDKYLAVFIPIAGLTPIIIFIWRLLSYYNYLFIGSILVPRWIKKSFGKSAKMN